MLEGILIFFPISWQIILISQTQDGGGGGGRQLTSRNIYFYLREVHIYAPIYFILCYNTVTWMCKYLKKNLPQIVLLTFVLKRRKDVVEF